MVHKYPFEETVPWTLRFSLRSRRVDRVSLVVQWLGHQSAGFDKELSAMREELVHPLPNHLNLSTGSRGRPIWDWDHKKVFSVRSAYFRLNDDGLRCPFAKVIWDVKTPLKIKVFLWLVIKCAILTWDNLIKKDWQGPGCAPYVSNEKSIDLRCHFSIYVWSEWRLV